MNKTRSPAIAPTQTWWLLATALAAFLPLAPHVPPWLVIVAALLLLWRGAYNWTQRKLPPRWLLIPLAIGGSIGVAAEFKTLFGQNPGVALLILFLALKPLEARARRDGLAIVFLAYFLALAQFFYAQSLGSAAMMLITVVVTTAALGSLADSRGQPRELLMRSGRMLLQATPFMLLLFVLFPRIQGPLWGLPRDAFSALSGLSDTMSPGSISNLSQSDAIAFRVKFKGEPPARDQLYWRGPVMTEFDGRTWRPERSLPLPRLAYEPAGPAVEQEVTLEAHAKPWLFALELPGELPPDALMTSDFQLLAKAPVTARQRYTITSRPGMNAGREESPRVLRQALELPRDFNPRTRELARGWREKGQTDQAVLDAAIRFFLTQGLSYTLAPPLMGRNSVDEFLFDAKQGFCEHFSGAFVFALRAAGIPARVVAGYQGGEINPFDGYFTIRQYDAHAWTEVWIRDKGWSRLDPTALSAPLRIDQNLAAAIPAGSNVPLMARADLAWLREVRMRLDAVTNTWNQWIIGYNPEKQREFLDRLGMHSPDWQQMTATLAVLAGLVLLGLTAWALRQRRHVDAVQRLWLRLSNKLAKQGVPRQPWEAPQAYAQRVGLRFPENAAEMNAIAELYGRLRYGKVEPMMFDQLKGRVARFKA
jgi:transglutaminase-like putative cysteine protease